MCTNYIYKLQYKQLKKRIDTLSAIGYIYLIFLDTDYHCIASPSQSMLNEICNDQHSAKPPQQ